MTDELHPDFLMSLAQVQLDEGESNIREAFNKVSNRQDARSLKKLLDLMEKMDTMARETGTQKWFSTDGKYPIFSLPKHKAFFDAGADYPERLFMAANR